MRQVELLVYGYSPRMVEPTSRHRRAEARIRESEVSDQGAACIHPGRWATMCTADADGAVPSGGLAFAGPGAALRTASAAFDFLNAACTDLDGAACGDLLICLGEVQAKL